MGCDIHWVLEKHYESGWIGVYSSNESLLPSGSTGNTKINPSKDSWFTTTLSNRNYPFFARLAGVRGAGPEPRGIPVDISQLAKAEIDLWGEAAHSHSWASAQEFITAWLDDESRINYITNRFIGEPPDQYNRLLGLTTDYHNISDYRVVYWFDN